MTKDEELDQLRAEKRVLCEALRRKDEELEQSHQANQDLREGLKQAIMAIEYLHERVKALEGQQAKDSHNSSLPPSSDRFVRPRHLLAAKERQEARWAKRPSWASPAAGGDPRSGIHSSGGTL